MKYSNYEHSRLNQHFTDKALNYQGRWITRRDNKPGKIAVARFTYDAGENVYVLEAILGWVIRYATIDKIITKKLLGRTTNYSGSILYLVLSAPFYSRQVHLEWRQHEQSQFRRRANPPAKEVVDQ